MKHNVKLRQKKLLTINFLTKIIGMSKKKLKTPWEVARKFLSKIK